MAKYRANSTDTWKTLKIKALDSMVIGAVIDYAGKEEKIPTGWLICDGSAISRTEYSELFDAIGTKWGTGDGSTTFNIPPAGIVRVGYDANDTDFNSIGKTGGSKELQKHSHTLNSMVGFTEGSSNIKYTVSYGPTRANTGIATDTAGTGTSGNLQPYGTFYTIIKAKDTTPTMGSIVNAYSTSTKDGYGCDYVNGANTYSTNEVNTHKKWIDGKDIYRKIITMTNQAVAQVSIGTITNLDTLVSLNGLLLSGTLKNVMGSHNDDSTYSSRLYMYENSIYYQQGTGWRSTDYTIQVIVEYTKTTD